MVLVLLAGRAAFLSTVRSGDLARLAADQQRAEFQTPAPRGPIVSSDGAELAVGRPAIDVSATPYLVEDPADAAAKLAPLVGRPEREVLEKLSRRGGYALIARNVDPLRGQEIRGLEIDGIELKDTEERYYPRQRQAAQLLGLTGDDGHGISGLERQADSSLVGRGGSRIETHDALGRALRVDSDREAQPGKAVRLTIDSAIQDRTERILAGVRSKYGARSATAIVMRPSDGAILAMATVPRYDPNDRSTLTPAREKSRPVTDVFEPGSTFKIVTIAGVLEEGLAKPSTQLELPEVLTLYDRNLRDSHERGPVRWSVGEILAKSSNVGTVTLAQSLGQARLQKWIARFGFGRPTGIDFPGEASGLVLESEDWSGTSIINIPIGQGIAVTLTQLTRAFAAIANGGHLVTPHLIARIGADDIPRPEGRRILTPETAEAMHRMLLGVVKPDGTGSAAAVAGYQVAGKTGTANKVDLETGEYSTRYYTSSFVGYVPADRPELVISVVVDEPSGAYYGGDVAAPAFEQIATFSLHKLGISP